MVTTFGAGAPAEASADAEPPIPERSMRIGEVAELSGTTARTIRYYEEIGLLVGGPERKLGKHRCYSQADVERIREIVRMKDLLGLSLEQLSQLMEAETARAEIRRKFKETDDPDRQRALLEQSRGHLETQLHLVRGRINELQGLELDLSQRAERVIARLAALEPPAEAAQAAGAHSGA